MLDAVLDTNVIVSRIILKRGVTFELQESWRRREWSLVTSPLILDEVQRVLRMPKIARTYRITDQDATELIRLLTSRATVVAGPLTISRTARDPHDDHIPACAKHGHADYVASGDQDLLTLDRFEGIPIVTPSAFAALLKTAR